MHPSTLQTNPKTSIRLGIENSLSQGATLNRRVEPFYKQKELLFVFKELYATMDGGSRSLT